MNVKKEVEAEPQLQQMMRRSQAIDVRWFCVCGVQGLIPTTSRAIFYSKVAGRGDNLKLLGIHLMSSVCVDMMNERCCDS